METALQRASRLLSALEKFAAEEGILLRTNDFADVVALQERAAPLIQDLSRLAADPAVEGLRPRVADLLARRHRNREHLEARLAQVQAELQRVDRAGQRLARLAPVYTTGSGGPPPPRLNTAA